MSKNNKKYQVNITSSQKETPEYVSNKKVDPNKYKNFDKLYKSYSDKVYSQPWYKFQFQKPKNRKTTLYIMIIIIVTVLVVMEFVD